MNLPKTIEEELMELPQTIGNLKDALKSEKNKEAMFEAIINGAMGEAGKENKYIKLGMEESKKKVSDYESQIKDLEEKLEALEMQRQYMARIKPSI